MIANTKRFSGPRVWAYLLVVAAFAGVWLGAKHVGVLVLMAVVILPAQLLIGRAVLTDRGYSPAFAWFSLLLGPMGLLVILGFPPLPKLSAGQPDRGGPE